VAAAAVAGDPARSEPESDSLELIVVEDAGHQVAAAANFCCPRILVRIREPGPVVWPDVVGRARQVLVVV